MIIKKQIKPTREKLVLQKCQFGVNVLSPESSQYVSDCGAIAIAKWSWGDVQMYVCREHDQMIEDGI